MQPKKNVLAFFVSAVFMLSAMGQTTLDQQAGTSKNQPKQSTEKGEQKMNMIKFNLMGIALKNYSFQYERVMNKHISLALGVRFMPNGSLPMKDKIIELADITDPDAVSTFNKLKVSNTAITPEIRFYLSKKGYGRGFYIAPYYRYASFKSDELPFDYTNASNQTNTINMKGDIKTHSGGLMFGAQWFLGKSVTLDWWIVGAHYGSNKGTFVGTTTTKLSTEEKADLQATLDDLSIPVGTLKSVVSDYGATINLSGPWAGVRAGLTLGIRF